MSYEKEVFMDVHGRLVAAAMGAIWGVLIGLLVATYLSYTAGYTFNAGLLVATWKSTIVFCSGMFALLGLVFGVSVGTLIGNVIAWTWYLIVQDGSRGILSYESNWVKLLVLAVLAAALYLYIN